MTRPVAPDEMVCQGNDRPRGKLVTDQEIVALAELDAIMADLQPEAAHRCIQWLECRYGLAERFAIVNQGVG